MNPWMLAGMYSNRIITNRISTTGHLTISGLSDKERSESVVHWRSWDSESEGQEFNSHRRLKKVYDNHSQEASRDESL